MLGCQEVKENFFYGLLCLGRWPLAPNYYPKVSLVLVMENGDSDGDPLPSRRLFMFG